MGEINWGIISGILIFLGGLPYMYAIYTGSLSKPAVSSYFLWTVIGALLFVTSWQSGVRFETTLFPILMGVVNPGIILLLSLRYGQYVWTRVDTSCVIVCIVTIVIWRTTDNPLLGIAGGICADYIATVPQLIKAWKDPGDEPLAPWLIFSAASAVNFLAVPEWSFKYCLFPAYMTTASLTIAFPILINRISRLRAK
jgi:hypothetical protein